MLEGSLYSAATIVAENLFHLFSNTTPNHFAQTSANTGDAARNECEALFLQAELDGAREDISAWPNYLATPLLHLSGLTTELGVADILYKDEGKRFGLGSFKALGGAFAVSRCAARKGGEKPLTVATATDGNHGLSVAWGARTHEIHAVIFIHAEVSARREQVLRAQGAEVVRIDGNYDQSVRTCYAQARENGWIVISDTTSGNDGHEVARTVMLGYTVMLAEIAQQLRAEIPTHVFVQGGVGGLAATVCECFRLSFGERAPRFIVVEPELAPCLFQSAKNNRPTVVEIVEETVMAGLSCGEVSSVAWTVLSQYADDFLTIPDELVAPTMKILGDAPYGDRPIVAGESAVAGLAGFISASRNASLANSLGLNRDSRVLVIGTEGATDPDLYEEMTGRPPSSV